MMQGIVDILPIGILAVAITLSVLLLVVVLRLRRLRKIREEISTEIEEGIGL